MMKEVREDFAKGAQISNTKVLAWESLVDSLYNMADTNQMAAFQAINNLMSNDTSLDRYDISDLHFIMGDIYYHIDSCQKSISEFTMAEQDINFDAPKILAARAGAYLKLKQYDNAFDDLNNAADINYDYLWNIGNYFEIRGERDSAIFYYRKLYNEDTTYYKFCLERADSLKKGEIKTLTKLIYRDRKRVVLLMRTVK